MPVGTKLQQIGRELKVHSPFTLIGAASGIVLMLLGRAFLGGHEQTLFAVFHPLHVVLSAMVTAALFEMHRKINNFFVILIIGVTGAIGVATLSDSILPFFGESILGVAVPTHADLHRHDHDDHAEAADHTDLHDDAPAAMNEDAHDHDDHAETADHADVHDDAPAAMNEDAHDHEHDETCDHAIAGEHDDHGPSLHLGFIEEWYLVFPAAILGVLLAYFKPATKLPHASHVLISTWASSAHILMNTQADLSAMLLLGILIVLFLSVWLPCCVSDIVFPLLFVGQDGAHLGHSCVLCGHKDKKNGNKS